MATLLGQTDIAKSLGLTTEGFDTTKTITMGGNTNQNTYDPAWDPSLDPSFRDPHYHSGLFSISTIIIVVAEIAFYILIGGFASYLSWTANASLGWHPILLVIFSILAFIFAGTYLIGHLIFKLDLLIALRAAKGLMGNRNTPRAPNVLPQAPIIHDRDRR